MLEFASNYMFGHWDYLHVLDANNHTSTEFKNKFFRNYFDSSHLPSDEIKSSAEPVDFKTGDEAFFTIYQSLMTDPYLHPLLAEDLSGLPRTVISSCYYDVLRDDAYFYAARLKQAGVKVHHKSLQCIHGWISGMSLVPQFRTMFQKMLAPIVKMV